jgi:hypothetical protein
MSFEGVRHNSSTHSPCPDIFAGATHSHSIVASGVDDDTLKSRVGGKVESSQYGFAKGEAASFSGAGNILAENTEIIIRTKRVNMLQRLSILLIGSYSLCARADQRLNIKNPL